MMVSGFSHHQCDFHQGNLFYTSSKAWNEATKNIESAETQSYYSTSNVPSWFSSKVIKLDQLSLSPLSSLSLSLPCTIFGYRDIPFQALVIIIPSVSEGFCRNQTLTVSLVDKIREGIYRCRSNSFRSKYWMETAMIRSSVHGQKFKISHWLMLLYLPISLHPIIFKIPLSLNYLFHLF